MTAAHSRRKSITYYPRQRKQKKVYVEPEKKAVVIAVVGAGGKSTYIEKHAARAASEGKRAAVTTTTHIYNPCVSYGLPDNWDGDETVPVCSVGGVDYFGVPQDNGKLTPISVYHYKIVCSRYDVVYVEADGSHFMPAKIPKQNEPVLPFNTDEVVVVMGKHAVGREASAVCQHYWISEHKWVQGQVFLTEEHLAEIADHYYIQPIRKKHPGIRTSFFLSDMYLSESARDVTDLTFVLMASGFGRRFSGSRNKLLSEFHGERLFQYALRHLTEASRLLREEYPLNIHINVVTRYPAIMEWAVAIRHPSVKVFFNSRAEEGITSSIRVGTRTAVCDSSQAVIFFAADMPYLDPEDICRFVRDFLSSGKMYGCMAFRTEAPEPEEADVCHSDGMVSEESDKRKKENPRETSRESGAAVHTDDQEPEEKSRSLPSVKGTPTVTMTVPGAFRLDRPLTADRLLNLHGDRGAMQIIRKHPWDTYHYYISRRYVEDIDYPEDLLQ